MSNKEEMLRYFNTREDTIDNLSRIELLDLLRAYDNYIMSFDDDFQHLDRVPICVEEFFDNEYKEREEY